MSAPQIICAFDCYPTSLNLVLGLAVGFGLAMATRRWRFVPIAAAIAFLILLAIEAAYRTAALGERPLAYLWWLWTSQEAVKVALIQFGSDLTIVGFFFALKQAFVWAIRSHAHIALRISAGLGVVFVLALVTLATILAVDASLAPRRLAEFMVDLVGASPERCKPDDARPVVGLPDFGGLDRRRRPPAPRLSKAQAALPPVYTTQLGGFEHLLTRRQSIRTPVPGLYAPHNAVALRLAINESGAVVAADPTAGPSPFYARAVEIASQWKFIPFTRDGKPTAVRMERMAVKIEGPELWSLMPSPFPEFSDWDTVTVQLRIFDPERSLSLDIRGDGSVTFHGSGSLVALQGPHCAVISRRSLQALIGEVKRANFFAMRDYYESRNNTVGVRVALDDDVKEITTGGYGREQAPERFWDLVEAILESVNAERWIKGNRFTGPSLDAERWDFSRTDEFNSIMLANVARGGDLDATRDLLARGALVVTKSRRTEALSGLAPSVEQWTALERAADRGANDTVDFLLASGVTWSPEALSGAYISALEYANLDMATKLAARGANRSAVTIEEKTALMAAARSGLPEFVSDALKRKPDVNAKDYQELTALHWAASADYPKAVDSVNANRRLVIDLLAAAGAEINIPGPSQWTPLGSNWMGLEDVTAALIAHGAYVNVQDRDGLTPLMTNKSVGAVRLLLQAGANPYLRNREGKNALEVARADVFATDVAAELERWMAAHPERKAK